MVNTLINRYAIVLSVALFAAAIPLSAKAAGDGEPSELFKRVAALDRDMFQAFNTCDIARLESFFAPDVEFYHDNDGLSRSRDEFVAAVKKNVCGKFQRRLVETSLEVWPLGKYGAVYSGTHLFCHTGAVTCEGQGRFLHILKNENGRWTITRVVSYDHKAAP